LKDEEQLIEQAKIDSKAFGQLYEFYYSKVFGYVFHVSGDYNISCDITSETFAKAFLNIRSFKWKGISISSWFFKTATNELNQYFRKKKYTPFTLIDLSVYKEVASDKHFSDETNAALTNIYMTENFKEVQKQLKSLLPIYQKVIALKYFEEMSIKEISEILGKKEGTVKSLLSRGIDKLRKLL
jgi:RNA polymerase sigma-70 factor (ECF subfamily)